MKTKILSFFRPTISLLLAAIMLFLFLNIAMYQVYGQPALPAQPVKTPKFIQSAPLASFTNLSDSQKVVALTQSMNALSNQNAQLAASNTALALAVAVNTNMQSVTWDSPLFVANYTNVYANSNAGVVTLVTNTSHVTNTYVVLCSSSTNWVTNEIATNTVTFTQLAPSRAYNFRIYTKSSFLAPNPVVGQNPILTNTYSDPIKGAFISPPNVAITITNGFATILWSGGTNPASLYASSGSTNWKLAAAGVPNGVASYMEKLTNGFREFKRK